MLLSLQGIQKSFGGLQALRDGNLEVNAGEVHLLMGENGAGKSTLMKIVAGLQQREAGNMLWCGRAVSFARPAEAAASGIAMVHQESLLAPHLSVAENIFLGRETASRGGWIRRKEVVAQAARVIQDLGFRLDPDWQVGRLSPAGRQLVEICRAVAQGTSLLIFDEPTSSLSDAETKEVFRLVRQLSERKVGIIYITHRLDELRSIGHHVTVLRDGATVHTGLLQDLSRDQLIRHMVGREVASVYQRSPAAAGAVLLKADGLFRGILRDISFEIRAGEIVGLAGLMGAGRTELCRLLFGIDQPDHGTVEVAGRRITPKTPRQAVHAGIALIPEDRQQNGLALKLPISINVTLPALERVCRAAVISRQSEIDLAEKFRQNLRIKCSSPTQLAGRLSGGNQQKVVIAKWVARGARVFLFDEPTRGIDIAAKQEVFEQMDQLARSGAAVLMVSSELSELIQVADRILVLSNGRLTGELPGRTTQEAIMRLAAPAAKSSENA